ncbi:MAG: serine/threonine-protein kinase [Verrucomicrobiae bacterium]
MTSQTTSYDHFEVALRPDGSPWVLGQGAMGVTYKAFDSRLQCHVALKVIQSALFADGVARERFLREARSAAAVHHPNVASVFYLGQTGEEVFYAMELVEGVSVEEELSRVEKLTPEMSLTIAIQICSALHALNRAGLVHRDIKPANIMLLNSGDGQVMAKLVDFGLAKSVAASMDGATLSQASGFLGTPFYASPEQINEQEVDARSDIYSLGATLFAMLAGRPPFCGALATVLDRCLHQPPPLDLVPGSLRGLLEKMLAKRPEDRIQTPQELRNCLEAALLETSATPGPCEPPPAPSLPSGPCEPPAPRTTFSLLELLKKRRALPPSEAEAVLGAMATELDRLGASGEPVVSRNLATISLSGTNLSFANVCACTDIEAVFQPEMPLVPGATIQLETSENPAQAMAFPQLLAHLAYELLGGCRQGKGGWTPVPVLAAQGNAVLRRGMEEAQAFRTASEFVAALKQQPSRRVSRAPARTVTKRPPASPAANSPPPAAGRPARLWVLATAGCTAALVAGLAVFVFSKPRASDVAPPAEQSKPATEDAPAAAPEPPPEDPSAPFLRAAEECRASDDNAGMLENFSKALEASPGSDDPRRQMEMISAKLRSNADKLTRQKFIALRKPLESAARQQVISAQILLGESLRTTEPNEALKWFKAAAANGQTEAMTQAGLMMANRFGGAPPDFPAAVGWFQQGAAAGDSDAMVALADCYRYGRGVPRSEIKAVEVLQAASALNHPQAMNTLGDMLKKGLPGYFAPNYQEAFRLFSAAQRLGNADAQANIGVLYANGQGVPKDPQKAFAIWKDGAENQGSPMCMFFYAMALEGGLVGEKKPDEAKEWYLRAAKGGNPSAVEWCRQKGVPLLESK